MIRKIGLSSELIDLTVFCCVSVIAEGSHLRYPMLHGPLVAQPLVRGDRGKIDFSVFRQGNFQ